MTSTVYTLSASSTRRLTQAARDKRAREVRKQALLAIIAIIASNVRATPARAISWARKSIPTFFACFILLSLSASVALMLMALMNVSLMFFLQAMGR